MLSLQAYFAILVFHMEAHMFSIAGKTMLVTGGSKGMGRLFCEHGVAEGAKVIIWATNEPAMQATADDLIRRGGTVSTYKVDVADRGAIEQTARTRSRRARHRRHSDQQRGRRRELPLLGAFRR